MRPDLPQSAHDVSRTGMAMAQAGPCEQGGGHAPSLQEVSVVGAPPMASAADAKRLEPEKEASWAAELKHLEPEKETQLAMSAREKLVYRAILVLLVLAIVGVFALLSFTVAPEVLASILELGDAMRDSKGDVRMIVGFWIGGWLLHAVSPPLPGGSQYQTLVAYIYGWPGFAFVLWSKSAGVLTTFVLARSFWRSYGKSPIANWMCGCNCMKKCQQKRGRPNKLTLLIMASLEAVQRDPVRTCFLFVLAPVPPTFFAAILGVKAGGLSWQKFLVGTTLGFIPETCLAMWAKTQAANMADMLRGDGMNASTLVSTIISIVVSIVITCIMGRMAIVKLREAHAPDPDKHPTEGGGPSAEGRSGAIVEGALSAEMVEISLPEHSAPSMQAYLPPTTPTKPLPPTTQPHLLPSCLGGWHCDCFPRLS
mmetsp:Transcript_114164/g.333756  ORF Transcript_114164/g.333756 Transcript_114164/m.333756 type:complete len:424 (-) Transcript_114164:82-1353(-)